MFNAGVLFVVLHDAVAFLYFFFLKEIHNEQQFLVALGIQIGFTL